MRRKCITLRIVLFAVFFASTALSCFATEKAVEPLERDDNSEKVIAWIMENNKWSTDAAIVKDYRKNVEAALGKKKAVWETGWGITKSGKAYRIVWTKSDLTFTEISPEDAVFQGFREYRNKFTTE